MNAMRQFALLTAVLVGVLLLPACVVYSLHPLYDDKHLTYDSTLEGSWQEKPGECLLVIAGDPTKREYTLQYSAAPENKDGCNDDDWHLDRAGPFFGTLVQLGATRFLDVVPNNQDVTKLGYIRGHFIFKVVVDADKLWMTSPRDQWLCDTGKQGKLAVGECMEGPYSDFIFTTSTATLQDFVQKHAEDDQVFPPNSEPLYRATKPETSNASDGRQEQQP